MRRCTKVIQLTGYFFTKEYEKKKKGKTQVRELKEDTVVKFFLEGDTEILVYFFETDREVLITPESSPEDIKRYLGEKFLQK